MEDTNDVPDPIQFNLIVIPLDLIYWHRNYECHNDMDLHNDLPLQNETIQFKFWEKIILVSKANEVTAFFWVMLVLH